MEGRGFGTVPKIGTLPVCLKMGGQGLTRGAACFPLLALVDTERSAQRASAFGPTAAGKQLRLA